MDISQLTDQELNQLAQEKSAAPNQVPDLSGLSDEELMQLAQNKGAEKPQSQGIASQVKTGAMSFMKGIPQGLGNAAIGGVQAATDLGESAAALIERQIYGDNMVTGSFGKRLAEQVKTRNQEQKQLPISERAGIGTGEVIPYLATGGEMGLLKGAAVSGAAMGALSPQEETGLANRGIEAAKSAAISTAGAGLLGIAGNAVKGLVNTGSDVAKGLKATPLDELGAITNEIKQKSSALYEKMRESGAVIRPQAANQIVSNLQKTIESSGKLNPRLHGDTLSVLDDLKGAAKSGNLGLEDLDQYRQLLSDVVTKNTDVAGKLNPDAFKANAAIHKLDDIVEGFTPNYLIKSGDKNAPQYLSEARQEWKRYRKFDNIVNIVKKSDGDANRLKSNLQGFVNKEKNLRGYTKDEVSALKDAASNSTTEKLLKTFGKFGIDLGGSRTQGNTIAPIIGGVLGGATGGLPGGVGALVVGTAARQAQKLAAAGKIDNVLKLIAGKTNASEVIKTLPANAQKQLLTRAAALGITNITQ